MDLVIRKTRNGRGIFAARDFDPGETLYEVTGAFVSGDEDDDVDESFQSNTFRYDADRYISPAGEIGDFQNHSCEPNAKVIKHDGRLYVAAAQAIAHGTEVLIDYSTIIADDDSWTMRCSCGTSSCRGVIGQFNSLPNTVRIRYITTEMVPEYIRAL
jgi:hypothetical protein